MKAEGNTLPKPPKIKQPSLHVHKLFEQQLQLVRHQLNALNNTMALIPPFNLTVDQTQALHDVLRHLDFENEYELGAKVRRAFHTELDAVKAHIANGKIRRRA